MKRQVVVDQALIERKIYFIRGRKVMLDRDLAELYGVETKRLNEQVRRNLKRFPEDFMCLLTHEETQILRSQFATLRWGQHSKYGTFAFTEPGIAMLSSVLNSERAIDVNIQIMRTFIRLRELLLSHRDLQAKMEALERKYDKQFKIVFDAIRQLLEPPVKQKEPIGFRPSR